MASTHSPDTAAALADALQYDPFYARITQGFAENPPRRRDVLARYFECSMIEGERIGRLAVWPDPSVGAAIWLLPAKEGDCSAAEAAKIASFGEILGPTGLETYRTIVAFMKPRAAAAVGDAAWYLSILGIAPRVQGQGIGARLLEPTLAEADREDVECYLETFDSRNPRFYEKLGFATVGTHLEPTTGAQYAIMRRLRRTQRAARPCRSS